MVRINPSKIEKNDKSSTNNIPPGTYPSILQRTLVDMKKGYERWILIWQVIDGPYANTEFIDSLHFNPERSVMLARAKCVLKSLGVALPEVDEEIEVTPDQIRGVTAVATLERKKGRVGPFVSVAFNGYTMMNPVTQDAPAETQQQADDIPDVPF